MRADRRLVACALALLVGATADAQTRTRPGARPATFLNARDFGADPTGATDSSSAVAAAIAALPSSGGTVQFPPGTYSLNLTITKSGVVLQGAGDGNVNTGLGGTKLVATNAATPLLQVGDGTTTVRPTRISSMVLVGDQTNATGDGIYIVGASDVALDNLAVAGFGRNGILVQSTATLPSSGIYMYGLKLAANRGASLRAEYGSQYVTNISIANSHINGWSLATSFAIYLDSVTLWMTDTYVDIGGNGVGHVKMAKSAAPFPGIIANGVTFDNPTNGTGGTTLDVSAVAAATQATTISNWVNGVYGFNGSVVFTDATSNIGQMNRGSFLFQSMMKDPRVHGALYLPLNDADYNTSIGFGRTGAAGGGFESIGLVGGARLNANVQLVHQALTYSASMTPAANAASIFEIIPTNAVAFTVNAPTKVVQAQFLTFRIKNSTAGALGAVTWDPLYKMAAWTQPAAGFSRSITFYHDGTALYEVSRTPADVPN